MSAQAATGTRAADLMRHEFESVAARDLERVAQLWDDRTEINFLPLGEAVRGEADLRAFFEELFTALPDMTMEIEAIHDVDETTAVGQWRLTGTLTGGPFQGVEPTGRALDVRGIDVMRFEDGMLRHNDVYWDGLSFARQIGLLPAPDSAADRAMLAVFNGLTRAKAALRERRGGGGS